MTIYQRTPAHLTADEFNALYPVGTPVRVYPGFRPDEFPGADKAIDTRTWAKAFTSRAGHPVVFVEDHGAYIALSHVDVATEQAETTADEAATTSEGDAL